jgi:exonuclease SbcD
MRILHFADVHIGIETYGHIDPQTGLSTRLLDTLAAFDEVVEHALNEHVDLVLFCGDAYRSREPSQTHQREFARRLLRLSQANIPVFLLVGNHDLPHALGRASALEIFGVLEVPQITIGDRLAIYRVETPAGPVQIVGLPWPRRSVLFSREEVRGLSLDEVTDMVQRRLADGLEREFNRLEPSIPAILAGHAMLSSATVGGERNMMLGQDHVLMPSSVVNPALDYVALGHVHRHQVLHQLPLTTYSGSLQRTDFGEAEEEKGFCIVDLDPSRPQGRRLADFRFVKVNARPFATVEVEIRQDDQDPTSTVLEAISRHRIQDAIVRLLISVPEELAPLIRDGELRAALEQAHHVASIRKETSGSNRPRLGMADSRTMSEMEALDKYLELRGIAPERKALLTRYARELLSVLESRPD